MSAPQPVAWIRDQRDEYEGPATLAPLFLLGWVPPGPGHGASYSPLYAAPPTHEPVRLTDDQRKALGLMLQHFGRDERIECLRPLAANGVTP